MEIDVDAKVDWMQLGRAIVSFFGPGILVWIETSSWIIGLAVAVLQLYILMVVQIYTGNDQ